MIFTARITRSGQVEIPADIRNKLGLSPGDTVTLSVNDRNRDERTPVYYTIDELDGILPRIPGDDDPEKMARDVRR